MLNLFFLKIDYGYSPSGTLKNANVAWAEFELDTPVVLILH